MVSPLFRLAGPVAVNHFTTNRLYLHIHGDGSRDASRRNGERPISETTNRIRAFSFGSERLPSQGAAVADRCLLAAEDLLLLRLTSP